MLSSVAPCNEANAVLGGGRRYFGEVFSVGISENY